MLLEEREKVSVTVDLAVRVTRYREPDEVDPLCDQVCQRGPLRGLPYLMTGVVQCLPKLHPGGWEDQRASSSVCICDQPHGPFTAIGDE